MVQGIPAVTSPPPHGDAKQYAVALLFLVWQVFRVQTDALN